jgi:XTP/dITP diphosphohydrolase
MHAPRRPLVVATSNPGKLREFGALLKDLPFDLYGLGELGIAPPEESGASFLENALLKARHAAASASTASASNAAACRCRTRRRSQMIRDSRSMPWAARRGFIRRATPAAAPTTQRITPSSWPRSRERLPDQRRARYRCALVFVRSALDEAPLIAEGFGRG